MVAALDILSVGMVTAVGLDAPSSCALTEVMTFFFGAQPASVPVVRFRCDLFLCETVLPPILTVPVPLFTSESIANEG